MLSKENRNLASPVTIVSFIIIVYDNRYLIDRKHAIADKPTTV